MLSRVQAYSDFDAIKPSERFFKAFAFHFSEGSMELVGTKATHRDILVSPTHNVEFAVRQKEKTTDMVLYCVREPEFNNDKAKLCGLQVSLACGI